jgi:molybdopterin biosynthesis enzyme MoaB
MRLEERGAKIVDYKLLSSKKKIITDYVKKIIEEKNPRLVILRGAVGVSRFDETPYATRAIIEDEIPGLATMLHVFGSRFTLGSWNARYQAGMVNKTLVISIPGARAAIDQLMYILPWLLRDTIDHMGETNLHSDHADPVEDFRMWA